MRGLCGLLLAALVLTSHAVDTCPSGSGQCTSKDESSMLQSRMLVDEENIESGSQEPDGDDDDDDDEGEQKFGFGKSATSPGGNQHKCPDNLGWITGTVNGGEMDDLGQADSEMHCLELVNKKRPTAMGAFVKKNGEDERSCYAVTGAKGMLEGGDKNGGEMCFFKPASLAEKERSKMVAEYEGAFLADETEIDDIADEIEEKQLFEANEDSHAVETKEACDPCDSACVEKASHESFVQCDSDKNNKISVKELQDCSLDESGASASDGKSLALGEMVTDAKAAELMTFYDEDKDNELSPDEWLKTAVPCPLSLREEGTVLDEQTVVVDCVAKIAKRVVSKENFKCKKTTKVHRCSFVQTGEGAVEGQEAEGKVEVSTQESQDERLDRWGRRRRRWDSRRRRWHKKAVRAVVRAVVCAWNTVVTWVNCVRDVISNIITSAVAGFQDCWNSIRRKVGGAYMDLIKNCNSVDACLKYLLKGPKMLWDKIVELAKKAAQGIMNSGPLGNGIRYLGNLVKKIPVVAKQIGGVIVDIGAAITKFVKGAISAIKDLGNINMCTTSGYGFWYYQPTDCGAFGRMKEIFKFSNLPRIPSIFLDVCKRFGTCVIKLGMLSLPSPFLDVKVKSFCVPSFLQPIIKGIVGTFRFIMAQIAAGIAGCKGHHAKQPICILVVDIRKVGDKIKGIFSGAMLLEQAENMGEKVHGDKSAYMTKSEDGTAVKCASGVKDFAFFIAIGGSISPGPKYWGVIMHFADGIGIKLQLSVGCRRNVLFADFALGLSLSLFIAGFNIDFPDPAKYKASFSPYAVSLGFAMGTPGVDIVGWAGAFEIAAAVKFKMKYTVKVGLGFAVLPEPKWPKGFAVTIPEPEDECKPSPNAVLPTGCGTPFLAQEKEEQQQQAIEAAETAEDKAYATVGVLLQKFRDMNHARAIKEGFQMQEKMAAKISSGDDVFALGEEKAEGTAAAPVFVTPKTLTLNAGLSVTFCFTCKVSGGQPTEAPPSGGGSVVTPGAGSWLDLKGKSATQSSTGWSGPASKAIDGNVATNYPSGSCTHTHAHAGAWWQVNLGSQWTVQKVKVFNRGDCCGNRLNGFNVLVGSTTCAANVGISQGQAKEVACTAAGSTVKIQLANNRRDYLTLCEVQVFA